MSPPLKGYLSMRRKYLPLHGKGQDVWAQVDAIYRHLAASGRSFSDSADLLREDRDR